MNIVHIITDDDRILLEVLNITEDSSIENEEDSEEVSNRMLYLRNYNERIPPFLKDMDQQTDIPSILAYTQLNDFFVI